MKDLTSRRLPRRIDDGDLVVRGWELGDVEDLDRAIAESLEHLRPWMAWAADEPQTPAERRSRVIAWHSQWANGGDVVLGIFLDGRVVGGTGLHRRRGPDTLEIGYWLHPDVVGRGLMTRVVGVLTTTAFGVPGVDHVEIHHDVANERSAGVPRRLGFEPVGDEPHAVDAPAEVGVRRCWRMDRSRWAPPAQS